MSKIFQSENEFFFKNKRTASGFTFVELIVVVAILALIFTTGYANYRSFQRRQELERGIRMVIADMRMIQEMAIAGVKPAQPSANACTSSNLEGYIFARNNANSYNLLARCAAGNVPIKSNVSLPANVILQGFGAGNQILFKALGRGIDSPNDICVRLCWRDCPLMDKYVGVTPQGTIKEGCP